MVAMAKASKRGDQQVISNRRARHEYFVEDTYECGIVLAGSEVKSIRNGRANLQDSYARVDGGEVWLLGMHVSPYEFSRGELDPVRRRKLLLHGREIADIERATQQKGVTLVPLRVTSRTAVSRSNSHSPAANTTTTNARRSPNATRSARPSAR